MVTAASPGQPLLEVRDLRVWFPLRRGLLQRSAGWVKAVDGVSFDLHAGETLGIVGESGCGKTTLGRAILQLQPVTGGRVLFEGASLLGRTTRELNALRPRMQIVFQDPVGSLNPRLRVGEIIGEALHVHRIARGAALRARVADLLDRCGLWPGAADRYPHEFSGGQRQRIAIARAIALMPRLIVCDEPTSALDVSVQAQILNLLRDLQSEFHVAYLFISHNMAVVEHMCDQIAVLQAGRIVELDARDRVIGDPQHPATRRLLAAVPSANPAAAAARATAKPPPA